MKILYVGPKSGTCLQRADAFRRLGHDVDHFDPEEDLPAARLNKAWIYQLGGLGLDSFVARSLRRHAGCGTWDIGWVDPGDLVGPKVAAVLRRACAKLVNLNLDNPFVSRDKYRWRNYLRAISYFDLIATPRDSSVSAALKLGAKHAVRITQAADEVATRPALHLTEDVIARYRSPVSFIGTWMPERGPFLARLIALGVPVRIFGPRWTKAPEYPHLREHVSVAHLAGPEYVQAIQCADIALCLLSKGNHDLHTTRSLEIPAIGTLLCAERTQDHTELYEEGVEAVFFSDADECAARCLELIKNPDLLNAIAARGHARNEANGHFNERLLDRLLNVVLCA